MSLRSLSLELELAFALLLLLRRPGAPDPGLRPGISRASPSSLQLAIASAAGRSPCGGAARRALRGALAPPRLLPPRPPRPGFSF